MRKFLFFLVALCTAIAASAWTVYFVKPASWTDEVRVYLYGGEGGSGSWDDDKETQTDSNGLVVFTSDAAAKTVIFKSGNQQYPGSNEPGINAQDGYVYDSTGQKWESVAKYLESIGGGSGEEGGDTYTYELYASWYGWSGKEMTKQDDGTYKSEAVTFTNSNQQFCIRYKVNNGSWNYVSTSEATKGSNVTGNSGNDFYFSGNAGTYYFIYDPTTKTISAVTEEEEPVETTEWFFNTTGGAADSVAITNGSYTNADSPWSTLSAISVTKKVTKGNDVTETVYGYGSDITVDAAAITLVANGAAFNVANVDNYKDFVVTVTIDGDTPKVAVAATEKQTVTPTEGNVIYFQNKDANWVSVYAHIFVASGSKDDADTTWPGVQLTGNDVEGNGYTVTVGKIDGVTTWKITLDSKYKYVIFNNNNSNQTADTQIENGKLYVHTSGSDLTSQTVDATKFVAGSVDIPVDHRVWKVQYGNWALRAKQPNTSGRFTVTISKPAEEATGILIQSTDTVTNETKNYGFAGQIALEGSDKKFVTLDANQGFSISNRADYADIVINFNTADGKATISGTPVNSSDYPVEQYYAMKGNIFPEDSGSDVWSKPHGTAKSEGGVWKYGPVRVNAGTFGIMITDEHGIQLGESVGSDGQPNDPQYYISPKSEGDNVGVDDGIEHKAQVSGPSGANFRIDNPGTYTFYFDYKTFMVRAVNEQTKYTFYLKYANNNNWQWDAGHVLDADGKVTIEGVDLGLTSSGNCGFNLMVKNGQGNTILYTRNENAPLNTEFSVEQSSSTDESQSYLQFPTINVENTKVNITFDFNNNTMLVEGEEIVSHEKVPVYFVNTKGWQNVAVWNYRNTENGGSVCGTSNKSYPGDVIQKTNALNGLIDAAYENDVYVYYVDAENYPQIIFNNNSGDEHYANRTRNLAVVPYGIYYPDDELLPTSWYHEEEDEMLMYPNLYADTPYNTVYVKVDDFTNFATNPAVDDEWAKRVYINIVDPDPDNGTLYTGVDGTTPLAVVTIAGQTFLRVSLPESILASGSTINLEVYEKDHKECTATEHKHKDAEKEDHAYCEGDDNRPLWNFSVNYSDGNVYTREGILNIRELVQPDNIYVINANDPNTPVTTDEDDGYSVVDITIDGNTYKAIRLRAGEGVSEKLIYRLRNVNPDIEFKMVVNFEAGATEENVAEYAWYSNPNNVENTAMRPGNGYPTQYGGSADKYYSINPVNENIEKYNIQIDWMKNQVSVESVATTANFAYASKNENGVYVRDINGFRVMDAVADDDESLETIHINHKLPHIEADDDEYFAVIKTTMSRVQQYDKYFVSPLNKPAYTTGKLTKEAQGLAYAEVRAHTAGIAILNVTQTAAAGSDADDSYGVYAASTYQVPVRVRPTIESIALKLNHAYVTNNGNAYSVEIMKGYEFGEDASNTVWNEERIKFDADMADTVDLEIYWAYGNKLMEAASEGPAYRSAESSVVAVAESALTVYTETQPQPETLGLTKYDNNNTVALSQASTQGVTMQIKQHGILSTPQYVSFKAVTTGVDEVEASEEVEAVYYDLNGVRVDAENLVKGIYVVVKGAQTEKIYVK